MYHIFTVVLSTKQLLGLIVLAVLSFFWKGVALWAAARRGDKSIFVVLLIVNSAGILELIYLYVLTRRNRAKNLSDLTK